MDLYHHCHHLKPNLVHNLSNHLFLPSEHLPHWLALVILQWQDLAFRCRTWVVLAPVTPGKKEDFHFCLFYTENGYYFSFSISTVSLHSCFDNVLAPQTRLARYFTRLNNCNPVWSTVKNLVSQKNCLPRKGLVVDSALAQSVANWPGSTRMEGRLL